jgi:uncharacterized membrane protein
MNYVVIAGFIMMSLTLITSYLVNTYIMKNEFEKSDKMKNLSTLFFGITVALAFVLAVNNHDIMTIN